MTDFEDIRRAASQIQQKPVVSVACPYDKNILNTLSAAVNSNLAKVVCVGKKQTIETILEEHAIEPFAYTLMECPDEEALASASRLVFEQSADILMKGNVHTDSFMKSVLSDKTFLKRKRLTHVTVYELATKNRLLFVSDPSILIEPSLEEKKIIVSNAIELLHSLGYSRPKVALISCTETVNPAVKSSVDAELLTQHFADSEDSLVFGPMGLDIAVSEEAKQTKKMDSEVCANADAVILPNLDSANIFAKGLTYIQGIPSAGIVMGAKKPVVLTSRSASAQERLDSLCLACLLNDYMKSEEN